MPVYEYACQECRHQFEELVFGSEKVSCPECRGTRLEKLVSGFAVGEKLPERGAPTPMPPMGACGSCGNPGGPGACSM